MTENDSGFPGDERQDTKEGIGTLCLICLSVTLFVLVFLIVLVSTAKR